MFGDVDKKMMLKFLEKNYPVSRLKYGTRFKRAIILDNGIPYLLSDEAQHMCLRGNFMKILRLVFDCKDEISKEVVKIYLNIK
jgi:uncharacterized protein YbaR (Trm112 family)